MSTLELDEDVLFSDVKQLPRIKNPIIDPACNDLFTEIQSALHGHDITAVLTNVKTVSTLSPCKDFSNRLVRPLEFVSVTLEDSRNIKDSKYQAGICQNVAGHSLSHINDIKEWIIQRRKLTKPLPAGKYPVVFAPGIGGILMHEVIGHQFELSNMHAAFSPTKYPKGHQLFSDNLTVVDAPLSLLPAPPFDDEGTIKRKTVLIKKGTINSGLTDRYSAHATGYPLSGNCRREAYFHMPMSRMYSTFVENGKDSANQAVEDIKYGFYVKRISYARCKWSTGDIIISASQASIIRHGKITDEPVTFIINDNASSFFSVKQVCNDMLLMPGYCHSASGGLYIEHGSPTLGFEGITISSGCY